ncbi:MAG: molybdenum cofactor biosynthesis protein MoaE [Pseudomonadota bacterium]
MQITVQEAPFDFGAEAARFAKGRTQEGAIITFTGLVRDTPSGDLRSMEIEHYPGMTERAINAMAEAARTRFSLADVLIIHRVGILLPGEIIMMVATAAAHRADAFAGASYLMDYLKSRAPFWKREVTLQGAKWVAATQEDEAAVARW